MDRLPTKMNNPILKVLWTISNYFLSLFRYIQSSLLLSSKSTRLTSNCNNGNQPQLNNNDGKLSFKSITKHPKYNNKSQQFNKDELKSFNKIPGPISLPFFGTMLTTPYKSDIKLSNQYLNEKYGPVVKLEYYNNFPVINIYNAEDIEFIIKIASIIRPPSQVLAMYRSGRKDRYGLLGLAHENGNGWLALRSLIEPQLYNTMYNRKLTINYVEIADDFVQLLNNYVNDGIDDIAELLFRFNFESALLLIIGKRVGVLDPKCSNRLNVLVGACADYFKTLTASFTGFPMFKYFSDNVWKRYVTAEDTIYETFAETVEELRDADELGGLMAHFIDAKSDVPYTDRRTLGMDLVLGALEPVHNTAVFTVYLIATNPKVAEKLFEELLEFMPSKNSTIDEESIDKMSYLKACIQESYRLMPTASRLAKFIEADAVLHGYQIPANTLVMCQFWHASLQDCNFYRANDFLPERWIVVEKDGKRCMPFTPHSPKLLQNFGCGKRDCPGRKFIHVEHTALLAKLFRNFKVEFPESLKTTFEFLLSPICPVPVKLIPQPE